MDSAPLIFEGSAASVFWNRAKIGLARAVAVWLFFEGNWAWVMRGEVRFIDDGSFELFAGVGCDNMMFM